MPKEKTAAESARPESRLLQELRAKLKRLEHKLEHRVPKFNKPTQDGSKLVTEQQIESVKQLIKKEEKKGGNVS